MQAHILKLFLLGLLLISSKLLAIDSHSGFIISAYDDRFSVLSPEKFSSSMEVVTENKTLVRMVGKITLNSVKNASFVSIDPQEYKKFKVTLQKNDKLHYMPLTPAFQEIELIVGNKRYEIPAK